MKFLLVVAAFLAVASAFDFRRGDLFQRDLVMPVLEKEPEGRITNGQTATTNQFPYQVGLSLTTPEGREWCGGSLISQEYVLTAAHCTDGVTSVVVLLGNNTRSTPAVRMTVSKSNIIVHPDWDSETVQNDIALIRIPSVTLTSAIQLVALPKIANSYPTYAGELAIASGWGYTSDSSSSVVSNLQYAELSVIANDVCKRTFGSSITNGNICVETTGGVSTCSGDSGGPLVLKSSKVQIGVDSFGAIEGCELGFDTAFTRVTSYLDWIKQETGLDL